MKLRLFAAALLLGGAGAVAQNPYIAPMGAVESAAGIVVSNPRTMLAVDLTVEHEVILAGPYARYAQKYLGVRAPLSDKSTWTLKGAQLGLLDPATAVMAPAEPAAAERRTLSHLESEDEFLRFQPDRVTPDALEGEDAAAAAAKWIFTLRRNRIELITGVTGEQVFGEGLKAALEEIARMEQSYLELFLGKRILTCETHRYTVAPSASSRQYIVCRFNATDGLLPDSDLSGDVVLLQIEPSGDTAVDSEANARDSGSAVACCVADPSVCSVTMGGREYARTVLPVFEFGRPANIQLSRRR